jgi:hypothetical protein
MWHGWPAPLFASSESLLHCYWNWYACLFLFFFSSSLYRTNLTGCFLDDIALAPFGLSNTDNGSDFAALYNFSIGVPTADRERCAFFMVVECR